METFSVTKAVMRKENYTGAEYSVLLLHQIDDAMDELEKISPEGFKEWDSFFDEVVLRLTKLRDKKCPKS